MENQNEFQDKEWQERNGMPNNQESDNTENNIFTDAGAEDEDIGPVNETKSILPDEDEGDNRFMDDEEIIDEPGEIDEEEDFEEFDDEDEEE